MTAARLGYLTGYGIRTSKVPVVAGLAERETNEHRSAYSILSLLSASRGRLDFLFILCCTRTSCRSDCHSAACSLSCGLYQMPQTPRGTVQGMGSKLSQNSSPTRVLSSQDGRGPSILCWSMVVAMRLPITPPLASQCEYNRDGLVVYSISPGWTHFGGSLTRFRDFNGREVNKQGVTNSSLLAGQSMLATSLGWARRGRSRIRQMGWLRLETGIYALPGSSSSYWACSLSEVDGYKR
ncbi:hypothetical protein GGR56DRAFT_642533 [Xylariaceae sp. FL0804]|nr:hypothetical protein GGR56DRAFT_642533 [Xylariaceae sp. FL0804]